MDELAAAAATLVVSMEIDDEEQDQHWEQNVSVYARMYLRWVRPIQRWIAWV